MKVTKEKIEENKVELNVEIDEKKVDEALEKAYQKIVKEVEIDGFRKGKVPRSILEKRFGKEVLHKDALDVLIPQNYHQAITEAEIEPIDQPEITDVFIEEGKPATFVAEVEVKPEVELGDYTGLEVEKEEVEVTDEQLENELETKRHQHSQLVATDKEEVEDGDHVLIDFEGSLNGEAFEGGSGEDYNLEIGSEQFIPGFEEQLIGTKVGEETKVEVTFPEEYQAAELAGQDVVFEVEVKEIKEKEVPELDDEFAKDLEFDSLADLKESINQQLVAEAEEKAKRKYENKLIEEIAASSKVSIPETMIEQEIESMLDQFKAQIQQQGIGFDQYLEMSGLDEEGMKEEYREQAEQRIKANLTLEAIAEAEGIEVSDEEIEEQVAEIAEQQGQEPEMVKSFLQMQGQLDSLVNSLKMQKTVGFLVENN
ncbi:trigger factor [Natroniella sulfidigena]|uniref:trigger factor n=1 Tax=Natroniella sulfidigena TaxID=723921 RepID=UPI00200B8D5B|nr:trigger factor [Natroniella sulfidigena]MCK8815842.1 trigger factor [Natroniella sulfidigena]